jgi:hypothetical protein
VKHLILTLHCLLESGGVVQVPKHDLNSSSAQVSGFGPGSGERGHLASTALESINQVTSDEPCGAGDQRFHIARS